MKRLKAENINSILFLDIETVPKWENLQQAPKTAVNEWIYKFKFNDGAPKLPTDTSTQSRYDHELNKYNEYFSNLWLLKAGLFAEFSKIICISAGYLDGYNFKLKSYSNDNEPELLKNFADDLTAFNKANPSLKLCAHFGKGFDYPFIAKRLLINRLNLPNLLDNYGLKPWENYNLDTHEIWKIGSFSGSGTLSSIAMSFGIPTPKDDISGADVAAVYYAGGLDRIVTYCDKDVLTVLNIFKAMRCEMPIDAGAVQKVI